MLCQDSYCITLYAGETDLLPSTLVPVFVVVLAVIWYGGIFTLNTIAKRRARAGRDLRE